jgi:hypothetical protein
LDWLGRPKEGEEGKKNIVTDALTNTMQPLAVDHVTIYIYIYSSVHRFSLLPLLLQLWILVSRTTNRLGFAPAVSF